MIDSLLSRLKKVKHTSKNNWIACCPAHDDKSPSMTIRLLDDGTVLVHCFAGCEVFEILSSIGLTFDDLYPEKPKNRKSERLPFNPRDILASVAKETWIAAIAAAQTYQGIKLSEQDRQRLFIAAGRLKQAAELSNAQ